MWLTRPPIPPLLQYVSLIWASRGAAGAMPGGGREQPFRPREHVLPTGSMHLAIRLGDAPLRVFVADSAQPADFGHAVVGGARSSFYAKQVDAGSGSVGAVLRAGAARALLGVPAADIAGRHVPLDALLGYAVSELRERLLAVADAGERLALLEAFLLHRLLRGRAAWSGRAASDSAGGCAPCGTGRATGSAALHPAVAEALVRFDWTQPISAMVERSGYSHRRFVALFEDAVGLGPRRYARVLRFQWVLARLRACPALPMAELALAGGYSDQSHFVREFREFSGVTPAVYRAAAPASANHVRVERVGR